MMIDLDPSPDDLSPYVSRLIKESKRAGLVLSIFETPPKKKLVRKEEKPAKLI